MTCVLWDLGFNETLFELLGSMKTILAPSMGKNGHQMLKGLVETVAGKSLMGITY